MSALSACLAQSTDEPEGVSKEAQYGIIPPPVGGIISLTSYAPTFETPAGVTDIYLQIPIAGQLQFTPHFDPPLQSDADGGQHDLDDKRWRGCFREFDGACYSRIQAGAWDSWKRTRFSVTHLT